MVVAGCGELPAGQLQAHGLFVFKHAHQFDVLVAVQCAPDHLVGWCAIEVGVVEVFGVVGATAFLEVFQPGIVVSTLALYPWRPPAGNRAPTGRLDFFEVNVVTAFDAVRFPFDLRARVGLLGIVCGAAFAQQAVGGAKQAAACWVGGECFGGLAGVFVCFWAFLFFEQLGVQVMAAVSQLVLQQHLSGRRGFAQAPHVAAFMAPLARAAELQGFVDEVLFAAAYAQQAVPAGLRLGTVSFDSAGDVHIGKRLVQHRVACGFQAGVLGLVLVEEGVDQARACLLGRKLSYAIFQVKAGFENDHVVELAALAHVHELKVRQAGGVVQIL